MSRILLSKRGATMPALAAYGPNPNSGVNVNDDHGWGGYCWPAGVPAELLGTAQYQDAKVTVRRELGPLFELAFRIADASGYRIFAKDPGGSGEAWGPWSYENRAISGTSTASNHSRGKAIDVNAPRNPFSETFTTDLPVDLVNAWELIGLCWGGRYTGQKFDTMHFEYGYAPKDVALHLALAQQILKTLGGTPPPRQPVETPPVDTASIGADGGWPIPDGHCFGPVSGPVDCHSGVPKYDSQFVRDYIAELQRQLNALGYQAGDADGIFGAKTSAATRGWQLANGRPTTARCTRDDWDAIHATRRRPAPVLTPTG